MNTNYLYEIRILDIIWLNIKTIPHSPKKQQQKQNKTKPKTKYTVKKQ